MIHIALYDAPGGKLIRTISRAAKVTISTGPHGCESLAVDNEPMGLFDAYGLYDRKGLMHCEAVAFGQTIWAGRVEDVSISTAGLSFTAVGYWSALMDEPIRALWSSVEFKDWDLIANGYPNPSVSSPELCEYSNEGKLYATVKKGETLPATHYMGLYIRVPQPGTRSVASVTFDYEVKAATAFAFYVQGATTTPTAANLTSFACTGAVQTGTISLTPSGYGHIAIFLYNPVAYTNTGDTGLHYFKITNLRVKSTTGNVSPEALAADFVQYANRVVAGSMVASGIDLKQLIFEDAYPADILTDVAALGNSAGQRLAVGVDEQRRLYLKVKDTGGRTWAVDVGDYALERSLSSMRNGVYAVYKDAYGRPARTTEQGDAASQARAGLRRVAALSVDTNNATEAGIQRNAALADIKDPTPRATLPIRTVYAPGGQIVPKWSVKAGDVVEVRNLPGALTLANDKIRSFSVGRAEYDLMTNALNIELEEPAPSLDFMVARKSAGI